MREEDKEEGSSKKIRRVKESEEDWGTELWGLLGEVSKTNWLLRML